MNCDICGSPGEKFSGFSFQPVGETMAPVEDPAFAFHACSESGCIALAGAKPNPNEPDDVAFWKWRCRAQRAAVRHQVFSERPPKTSAEVQLDQAILTLRARTPLDPFWAHFDAEVLRLKK